ncbi:NADH-quinone oxidoreductase subunit M [bacterium]|nr:NADH-quinone oxidoreductase subunit M [bacterium]
MGNVVIVNESFLSALQLFFMNPLNQVVFLPLFGAIAIMFFPKDRPRAIKAFSLIIGIATVILSVFALAVPTFSIRPLPFITNSPGLGYTLLVLFIIVAAFLISFIYKSALPKFSSTWVYILSIATSIVILLGIFFLKIGFVTVFSPDLQIPNHWFDVEWIPLLKVHYTVGIDGLSLPLFLLTSFVGLMALIGSFSIKFREKEYFVLFLILEFAMLGVFVALDYFLFYVFWEIMLVPMYFLIAIWGGKRKEYAAIKFFLYTLFGSVFMLICIIAMRLITSYDIGSWNMLEIADSVALLGQSSLVRTLLFVGLIVGFAIKVPMFPFHTWLPDAHVEAPTAISVILAGVLLKMGTYGFLRVAWPTFPDVAKELGPFIAVLSVIAIIYGALVAMAQADLKKLIAYSSVSHMGYMTLGISVMSQDGINGAIMLMCAHGLSTGALFLLVGVIYDRAHTKQIADLGGLYNQMPQYTGMMSLAAFTSLGLPGLVGFWGEFLILKGTFQAPEAFWMGIEVPGFGTGLVFFRWMAVIAAIGMILTAGYLLWMIERVFLGKAKERWNHLKDLSTREWWSLAPLGVFMVIFGVYPKPLMDLFSSFSAMMSARLLG